MLSVITMTLSVSHFADKNAAPRNAFAWKYQQTHMAILTTSALPYPVVHRYKLLLCTKSFRLSFGERYMTEYLTDWCRYEKWQLGFESEYFNQWE